MALLDLSPAAPAIGPLAALRRFLARPAVTARHEGDRARRAHLQEMICASPEAFGSEADVHAMMQLYPGRF